MVWKVNATNKDVELEVKLEPLGVKKIEVAEQELNEAWEFKYPRVFVKDQATLVFKETAQKSDQGNYTMAIRRSKMPKIKSTVELIILGNAVDNSNYINKTFTI